MTTDELRSEITKDPASIGYLPLYGEREVFEHAKEANSSGVHIGQPIKVKRLMKLVGNDVANANLLNRKTDARSRAEILWGKGAVVTAQDVADTAKGA